MISSTNTNKQPLVGTPNKVNHHSKAYQMTFKTPRMSPSPACYSKCTAAASTRRRTSGRVRSSMLCSSSQDRFIPNRARTDSSQVRASLLSRFEEACDTTLTQQNQEYKKQLRRALFGLAEASTRGNMLAFGSERVVDHPPLIDPFSQDILRAHQASTLPKSRKSATRQVSTRHKFILEAPMLLQDDHLTLVSCGPALAVALNDWVYLSSPSGGVLSVRNNSAEYITSLKWSGGESSTGTNLLAFGTKDEAIVLDPFKEKELASLVNHSGYVTALDWQGKYELVSASEAGVKRYDLRMAFPEVGSYRCSDEQCIFSGLKWFGDTIAASGGDTISIWDARRIDNRRPVREVCHEGVKSIAFCPYQSNLLASGGCGGMKVWDWQTGCEKSNIHTESSVTSVLWSPYRRELMGGYGSSLGVWSITKEICNIGEWDTGNGRVLCLEHGSTGGEVVSLHSHEVLAGWDAFGKAPVTSSGLLLGDGLLSMPVIR